MTEPQGTVVLGIGNPIMGDDGLGILAVESLRPRYRDRSGLEFVDGGTWGMGLLHVVEAAARLVLVDAIDVGAPPGTLVTLERSELPRMFGAVRLSPHQVDLRDVLALAELRGTLSEETVAFGIQPHRISLRLDLTDAVSRRVPELLRRIEGRLARWGHAWPDDAHDALCTR